MKIIHFLGKKLNFYIISTTFVVSYYSASAQDIPYVKMDVEKGVIKYEVNGTKILTESNEIPAPKILSEITKTLPISENEKILAVIFCNKIDLSIITTITLIAQKAGHDKTRLFYIQQGWESCYRSYLR